MTAMMPSCLQTYPAYKPSGVEWLGDVPAHWDKRKLRSVLTGNTERNRPDLPLLSVVRERGVVRRDVTSKDENRNFIPDDLSNYKVVRAGQFAMNKMKAWQGSYGVSAHDGIVSPAYFVFDLDSVTERYFHIAVRSKAYVPFFGQASDGVRIGQWDLSQARMREIPFFVPSIGEQAAIVRYLDCVVRRIRRYVAAKEKLIGLLEEEKQAVIHRAVTRGLDPNVPLKPSGVEWLGDVPAHWEVRRTKSFFRLRTEKSGVAHGRELLSIYTHIGVRPRKDLEEKGNKASSTDDYWIVKRGDLIANKLLAWMGAIGVSHYDGVTSPAYDILMPIGDLVSDYYHHLFRTRLYLQQFKQRSRGIMDMRLRLYFDQLGLIPIPVPPVDVQQAIVECLDKATADIDAAVARARRQIELLQEYRTRLIADVVTGKLDVREAAATLPDATDDRDPIDESRPLAENIHGDLLDADKAAEELVMDREVTV